MSKYYSSRYDWDVPRRRYVEAGDDAEPTSQAAQDKAAKDKAARVKAAKDKANQDKAKAVTKAQKQREADDAKRAETPDLPNFGQSSSVTNPSNLKNLFLRGPSLTTIKTGSITRSWILDPDDKSPDDKAKKLLGIRVVCLDKDWGYSRWDIFLHKDLTERAPKDADKIKLQETFGKIWDTHMAKGEWAAIWNKCQSMLPGALIFSELYLNFKPLRNGPSWLGWCSWAIIIQEEGSQESPYSRLGYDDDDNEDEKDAVSTPDPTDLREKIPTLGGQADILLDKQFPSDKVISDDELAEIERAAADAEKDAVVPKGQHVAGDATSGIKMFVVDVGSSIKKNKGYSIYKYTTQRDYTDEELIKKLGEGGAEGDFEKFKKLLDFISKECSKDPEKFYTASGKKVLPLF